MALFDICERTSTRLKDYKEPEFAYLNQSSRPSVVALRQLLEEWFDHFPEREQTDLRSRFRSSDDYQHISAFFELYIHELLRKLGYEVTPHPILGDVRTHPDFLARRVDGCELYVEVTVAGIPARSDQAADARIAQVYDALNQMDSPDFFLHLRVQGSPSTPPAGAKLRSDLAKWLRTLNFNEVAVAGKSGSFDLLPKFRWNHDGWLIDFMPIAKSPSARGKPGIRPIGAIAPEAQWLQTDADLKDALEAKAKKYGELELPLVIAVNVLAMHCDDIDIHNALFGQEMFCVKQDRSGNIVAEHAERKRNGFWFGPDGPRNQNVSAVLIADGLDEWAMGNRDPELFHNPYTKKSLRPDCWPLTQHIPDLATRKYEKRLGGAARQVLGLPEPWPPSWD